MSEIRFLLDENVNPILRSALLRSDPNLIVWQVGRLGAPPLGTLDPDILIWCENNGFILVTNNRKSMPVHLKDHLAIGRRSGGIFILNVELSVGETVEELLLIGSASVAEDYQDQIIYLPIG